MTTSGLPESWVVSPLGHLGVWNGGGTPTKSNPAFWKGDIPWVSPKDIKVARLWDSSDHLSTGAIEASATTVIAKGSVLVVTRSGILAHTLPIATNEVPLAINQDLKAITPFPGIDAEYLAWALRGLERRILKECSKHGTTVHSVEVPRLQAFNVPVAPRQEQRRIVAKIEELFSELDKGIESLKTARRQLEVYRQSVLKYAFEGKLTAQWREENTDKLETREQLLARVKKERAAYYERQIQDWMTVVKDWETKGQLGKKPSKPKKPSAPFLLRAEDLSSLPRLPEGWSWLSLSAVVGHVQTGPFGSLLHKADYVSSGTPLVNPSHIRSGRIQPDRNLAVSSDSLHRLKKYVLQENDIVIGRRGEMGRCAVVTAMETGWLCGTGSLLVRPLPSMNPGFYSWVLGSQRVKDFLAESSIGTTMHNLNEGILHRIPVPVCSRHEQDEVFNEIRRQYQRLDELEAVIDFEVANSASLRQSILTKAFAGRLVLQDLNDEPASVLLDRIKEEKAKSSDLTRRNRKAKTAA